MSKLKSVKRGWRLDAIFTSKVEPAKFFKGKLPFFEASALSPECAVETPGGWRGGSEWQSHTIPGPWGLPSVV